jgi:hypothetical protein
VKQLFVAIVTLTVTDTDTGFPSLKPAHGKRSGTAAADDMPDDGSEAVASVAFPEDTRFFLSKLVRQVEPSSRGKMWQRLAGVSVPSEGDRRHREAQWRNSPTEEDAASAVDSDALSR